eukprot:CAMPEP_0116156416 /NCGR_PEP_ID=MMETSP0329-20121206/22821_1 /TAXON_ID=697910 /ORGANISM="Pseudo-nitzschia arenysensis, Strain B593" /LENGTH=359 /DNA_ID=CAMNT_0003653499 /DNA_START=61 /DNA_END=1140 /DNA_ORIENTATION=+
MRGLSVISLMGVLVSFGPTSTLGFLATPKPIATTTLKSPVKFQKPAPPFIHPRVSGASTSTAMNAVSPEVLACFLAPAMGFLKTEWTVSYGYGFATAFSSLALLLRQQNSALTTLHAASMVFYGLRLNAFLYLRTRLSSGYREIAKNIDEKSNEKYPTAISRLPFILSCGLLFYGLYLPVSLTSKITSDNMSAVGISVLKGLIGLQWLGFVSGAVGDLTKSYVKGSEKDGKFLVTSGIFSILRHPNYSGEILSWTSNLLCCALSTAYLLRNQFSFSLLGSLGLATMGCGGMVAVLLGATTKLEAKQEKNHGETEKYKKWIKRSWSGWTLPSKTGSAQKEEELPEITLNADSVEDFGSGI